MESEADELGEGRGLPSQPFLPLLLSLALWEHCQICLGISLCFVDRSGFPSMNPGESWLRAMRRYMASTWGECTGKQACAFSAPLKLSCGGIASAYWLVCRPF